MLEHSWQPVIIESMFLTRWYLSMQAPPRPATTIQRARQACWGWCWPCTRCATPCCHLWPTHGSLTPMCLPPSATGLPPATCAPSSAG